MCLQIRKKNTGLLTLPQGSDCQDTVKSKSAVLLGKTLVPGPHPERFSCNGSEVKLGLWCFCDSVTQ